jgi:PAS domain-containing protein
MLDAMPDLLFELGLDGFCYDYHSPRTDLLPVPADQIVNHNINDIPSYGPVALQVISEALHEANETGFSHGRQFSLQLPQGERYFEISVAKKQGNYPEPRFIYLRRDVTDRKMMENHLKAEKKKLEESNAFNNILLHTLPFPMSIVDRRGRVLFMSEHMKQKFPYEIPPSTHCWDIYRDDKRQCMDCPLHLKMDDGAILMKESTGVFGGKTFEVYHTGMHFEGTESLLEIFVDITERKTAETALRERVKELRCIYSIADLIEKKDDIESVIRDSLKVIPEGYFHPEIAKVRVVFEGSRYESEGFRETPWTQSSDIFISGQIAGKIDVSYREGRPFEDGKFFLPEEQALLDSITERLSRFSERKEIEKALHKSEEKLQAIFDMANVAFVISGIEGRYLMANRHMAELF